MTIRHVTCALCLLALLASPAWAGDDDAWPAPAKGAASSQAPAPAEEPAPRCPGRVALIPAHKAWLERQIVIPAVTKDVEVPVYDTVKVPVYGTLTVPEVRRVEVPVYGRKSKSVKMKLWNPFRCWKEFDVKLWDREKCVQTGTEIREEVVERTEQVVVGEREERVLVGHRLERVVVEPERVELVRQCVDLPDQWVTLGPPGTPRLPDTLNVMSEAEYAALLRTIVRAE
jgi:hypothetical protein